jgi:organic hydroperoxide reductase OsmC/OhrA
MNATMIREVLNGIDVTALKGTMETVRVNSDAGQTHWEVNSHWRGGTRSDHSVQGCRIGGQEVPREFTIQMDEPIELCGTNQFANPQEYLLSAMNACMMVGYSAVAALMGIKLAKLEIRTWGDIDLRGFLGIDSKVPPGYKSLQQTVTIAAEASDQQLRHLHETIKRTSPNYFNITSAVPTQSRLVIE